LIYSSDLSRRICPRLDQIGIDWPVLLFTAGISLTTGLLFGLAPALQSIHPPLNEMLKEGDRTGTSGPARHRVRDLLVIGEVAISLVLLIAAGC
jgi:putative ABC transport system permease protein